jgi:hypothetical protein
MGGSRKADGGLGKGADGRAGSRHSGGAADTRSAASRRLVGAALCANVSSAPSAEGGPTRTRKAGARISRRMSRLVVLPSAQELTVPYIVKADGPHLKQITTFGIGPGTGGVDWGPNTDD